MIVFVVRRTMMGKSHHRPPINLGRKYSIVRCARCGVQRILARNSEAIASICCARCTACLRSWEETRTAGATTADNTPAVRR